jgi:hypothetical protein
MICLNCGVELTSIENRPFCSGFCRSGYRAERVHDSRTDWVRVALVRDSIRRSWPAGERRSRRVMRRQPVELLLTTDPREMS